MKIKTIKSRLLITIMVTSLLSLSIACGFYSLYDLSRYRSAKQNELELLVQLISPLFFEQLESQSDRPGRWQKLVAEQKSVQQVVLYKSNYLVVNTYKSSSSRPIKLLPEKGVRILFDGDYCLYNTPLVHEGETVGFVAIDYKLIDRVYGFRSIVLVFVGTFVFATCVAYLMSSLLQSQFNKSISSLVDFSKLIYKDKNYKARAVKHSDDELGLLTDTINEMLDEISRREDEMKILNDHLESRVETRTAALQEINARLLNEKTRADQASSVKSDFLANMSHEIRTPMNGIVASCDLAVAEDLSPKVANYVKIIQSSSHTLLLIINDILDFSRLEAGTLELEESPFSLAELLCKLGGVFKEQANQNNIELVLNVESGTPDLLIGDRGRFQQILTNLLDNGIKFTPEGKVSLNIVCLEKKDKSVILECRIRDTGVGLSEDGLSAIFRSFHQVDSSSTRKFGGTGLGLAITKKLAIMMGGTIEVSSQLGQGSSFIVTVRFGWMSSPLGQNTLPKQQGSGNAEDLFGKHVLLAEDNETNRGIAEAMLTGFGLTVDSVENGALALEALAKTEYDFVILDIQMPVLGGYDTMRQIRENDQYADLPLVALTAHALPGDKEKCLQAGANAYLSKPMRQDTVLGVLTSLFKTDIDSSAATSDTGRAEALITKTPLILDIEGAAKNLGVDQSIYRKVLSTFYYDYINVEEGLLKAVEGHDLDFIKKKIHSLKGSSATVGAEKLTEIASSIDLSCKQNKLPTKTHIQTLILELKRVKDEAKQFIDDEPSHNEKNNDELVVLNQSGLTECFTALAQALDESLYDQINTEVKKIEENITGSKVTNLAKIVRMYAYDDALLLLDEIAKDLDISINKG